MAKLDLLEWFENEVAEMLIAVSRGRATHKAGNIKASGAALENRLRQLFQNSLPSTNRVVSGYFYGADSSVSGEIDLMIYEDQEAFRLDPASQDQHYIPYTSVSIIGQIKNSARDLEDAIGQVQKAQSAWESMRQTTAVARSGRMHGSAPTQEPPLTFVVCGNCSDAAYKKLRRSLEAKGRPYVDYILLLDRGVIVAGSYDLLVETTSIDFQQYRQVSSLYLCEPSGAPNHKKGVALLWFYFSLVSKLSLDRGYQLRYHSFCEQISSLYSLLPKEKLV